MSVIQVSYYY